MAVYALPITINELSSLTAMQNTEEYFPNGLKVSKPDQPMFFPVENTYQVGSAEINALMANAVAVGTGQTGAAPLYVFCTDGVYALFVDSSGQMTYSNARVLARDVVNNPRSVTPIDNGVVFTTDRGLMMIAGNDVQEIGQPAEGDVLQYADSSNPSFIKIAKGAFTKLANLPLAMATEDTDFLTYIQGAIVNYNHNLRELIVSNPNKDYSYILDREGNWSRRIYTADQYVNNFPVTYRMSGGAFYKMDDERAVQLDGTTANLEKAKEAPNDIFWLSNIIKLDSIGFKQVTRFVVRGYFDTSNTLRRITQGHATGIFTEDTANYAHIPTVDYFYWPAQNINKLHGGKTLEDLRERKVRLWFRNNDEDTSHAAIQMGIGLKKGSAGLTFVDNLYTNDVASQTNRSKDITLVTSEAGVWTRGELFVYSPAATTAAANSQTYAAPYDVEYTLDEIVENAKIGIYVFGSYDGRQWSMLGGNEKSGKFTDLGCKVERTDVKFLRICLAGQVTGKTRIDYLEISHEPSVLNTKIR